MLKNYKHLDKSAALVCVGRNEKVNSEILRFAKEFLEIEAYNTIAEYPVADFYVDINSLRISNLQYDDWKLIKQCFDMQDVILKDRLLRNIELLKAKDLVLRVSKYFIDLFSDKKYKVLVMYSVDNYVTDIMVRMAKFFGVEVCAFCPFFVAGYRRINVYGEHNKVRDVESSEVQTFKNKIVNRYKSPMAFTWSKAFKNSLVYYFRYKVKYLYFHLWKYKMLGRLEYDYISVPYAAKVSKLRDLLPLDIYTEEIPEKISSKDIYIPLHYHPEMTIEYWADTTDMVDYITSLIEVVTALSHEGYSIYIKEHPVMCFRQDPSVYQQLLDIPNVYIIDPFMETGQLLDHFENIAVWTGSTGVEALLNDKKVFFTTSNYYFNKTSDSLYEIKQLNSEAEKDEFVENILHNTIVW